MALLSTKKYTKSVAYMLYKQDWTQSCKKTFTSPKHGNGLIKEHILCDLPDLKVEFWPQSQMKETVCHCEEQET